VPRLRWQQAEGARHARVDSGALCVEHPFETLCGLHPVPQRCDLIELGGTWLAPTCLACETVWLATPCTSTGELLGPAPHHELSPAIPRQASRSPVGRSARATPPLGGIPDGVVAPTAEASA
jgi:hypothetical protein